MSKNNSSDWESLLSSLTEENRENSQESPKFLAFTSAIFAFISLVGVSAVAVMLINMVINSAWPELTALSPGIGYRNAAFLSALIWFITFIKLGITSNVSKTESK